MVESNRWAQCANPTEAAGTCSAGLEALPVQASDTHSPDDCGIAGRNRPCLPTNVPAHTTSTNRCLRQSATPQKPGAYYRLKFLKPWAAAALRHKYAAPSAALPT